MHLNPARAAAALGLLTAVAAVLGWAAFASPRFVFLRPSAGGRWVLDPRHPGRPYLLPPYTDTEFRRRVALDAPPAAVPVRITATAPFTLSLNGQPVDVPLPANWKRSARIDLGPRLRAGENTLAVRVAARESPPLLLVEGAPAFRSGPGWSVAAAPFDRPFLRVAVADRDEPFLRRPRLAFLAGPRRGWALAAAGAWVLLLAWLLAAALRRKPVAPAWPAPPPGRATGPAAWWRRHGFFLAVFAAIAVIDLWGAARRPPENSLFDAHGHADYIRYVAREHRVPLATDGWKMFQPPLYYAAAAGVYRLAGGPGADARAMRAVLVFSTGAGLLLLAATWGILLEVFPACARARHLGLASVAALPMCRYMNPSLTNETFAATMIALALLAALRWCGGARPARAWQPPVVGLLCGLALLSKYTAIFLVAAVAVWLGLEAVRARGRGAGRLLTLLAVCALVAGGYYARNVAHFGNPFIGNWDEASGFHYRDPPGYRTAAFYTRFGTILTHPAERARWAGFWDGMYGSAWGDTHGAFVPVGDPRVQLAQWVIYLLALLPTAAAAAGAARLALGLLRGEPGSRAAAPLLLLSLFAVAGLMLYTLRLPHHSTVKAFFVLSLVPAAAVFAGRGLEALCRRAGALRWAVYGVLAALAVACLLLFHYRPPAPATALQRAAPELTPPA